MIEEKPNTKRQSLWERCTFDNILISIIFIGGGAMLILAGILFVNVLLILCGKSGELYENVRNLILSMGGVGAAIGLWFGTQRQKTFEEQVQALVRQVEVQSRQMKVQAKQVELQSEQVQREVDKNFDDRLGRNVELLKNENVIMRNIGIRGLVDLVNSANKEQKSDLADIIYNFFCDRLRIHDNDDVGENRQDAQNRQDVQNALNFLINLSVDERTELLSNRFVVDKLDFRHLDFSHLSFTSQTLENIDFSESKFNPTTFKHGATIENVKFSGAEIEKVEFSGVEIKNSHFAFTKIAHSRFISCFIGGEESTFTNVTIEKAHFSSSTMTCEQFDLVKFIGGTFAQGTIIGGTFKQDTIKVLSTANLPYFIGADLSGTHLYFDDGIYLANFLHLCYYSESEHLSKMDATRKYEFTHGMSIFVKSDEAWSEQPAKEWVAVEVAKWKIDKAKEDGEDTSELEKELNEAANELQRAQELHLARLQGKFHNPLTQ